MLPSLALLRQELLSERESPIGVYYDNPPSAVALEAEDITVNADDGRAWSVLFDAVGPRLGVHLRELLHIYLTPETPYVLTVEDKAKKTAFEAAYKAVMPERWNNSNTYANLYEVIWVLGTGTATTTTLTPRLYGVMLGAPMARAMYELHISYVRYVWNLKVPGSEVPLDDAIQRKLWMFCTAVFSYVYRFWFKFLTGPRFNSPRFSKWGTPYVDLGSIRSSGLPQDYVIYRTLTEYWAAQARLRWTAAGQRALLIAKMQQAWMELYQEVSFRPGEGHQGYEQAFENWNDQVDEMEKEGKRQKLE